MPIENKRQFVGQILEPGRRPQNATITGSWKHNTIGWEDYTADLSAGRLPASAAPTWANFRDGIDAYSFSASQTNSIFITFHIKHDYAYDESGVAGGSLVYPHVHWAPNTTSTGVVRWGMEYTVAKGHQQESFPASTTVYVNQTISSSSQYLHCIAEVSDDDAFDARETDAIVLMRIFRDGSDAADTFPDAVFAFTADLHYQANKDYTPNKAPPFLTA